MIVMTEKANSDTGKVFYRKFELEGVEGVLHRNPRSGPAEELLDDDGKPLLRRYSWRGKLHRTRGPAEIIREADGTTVERYFIHGKAHRVGGPAERVLDSKGVVTAFTYLEQGLCHREDGPARYKIDKTTGISLEEWLDNGIWHREPTQGPAIIEQREDKVLRAEVWLFGRHIGGTRPQPVRNSFEFDLMLARWGIRPLHPR